MFNRAITAPCCSCKLLRSTFSFPNLHGYTHHDLSNIHIMLPQCGASFTNQCIATLHDRNTAKSFFLHLLHILKALYTIFTNCPYTFRKKNSCSLKILVHKLHEKNENKKKACRRQRAKSKQHYY